MSVCVLSPGLLTSTQDLGRHGHAALGVGGAGAMDKIALRIGNALVGNPAEAAGLEMTLRGPRLRFDVDCTIAVTGAEIDVHCGDQSLPTWRPLLVRAGSQIDFGIARRGARAYLAVGGGLDVERVLGSRSSDINASLGPLGGRALAAGDVLPLDASASERYARLQSTLAPHALGDCGIASVRWSVAPGPWFDPDPWLPIGAQPGIHFAQLDASSQRALWSSEFRIALQSNRVGFRLDGPSLAMATPLELISEGTAPGTVQLPPGGQAIVLMAEAPTTGGYPRIAHVAEADLSRLAQRRPGERVRFVQTSLDEAQSRYLQREHALTALLQTISERLAP